MSSYFGSSNGIGEVTKSQQKGTECQKKDQLARMLPFQSRKTLFK